MERFWTDEELLALPPVPPEVYAAETLSVAPGLLGRVLVHETAEGLVAGRIIEVEAYLQDDPACHAFRGLTPRTSVMFGAPGHAYIYLSYGMHWCLNAVTRPPGQGEAVLIRAVRPVTGFELMRRRRGVVVDRLLCSGPGRLAQAFGLDRGQNGVDLTAGSLRIVGTAAAAEGVIATPRVGISVARDNLWRFCLPEPVWLSRRAGGPLGRSS